MTSSSGPSTMQKQRAVRKVANAETKVAAKEAEEGVLVLMLQSNHRRYHLRGVLLKKSASVKYAMNNRALTRRIIP